ncbi:peptidase M41-like protein [Martelella mediterranea]|uniref:Peptidase M41-like protein n=2 Tax=Martelella mediterranea TaxID=293089 RepID=A0A4V6P043_9HYPH|nr:peptidase M41-like protein [Martelella mediterranea]
MTFLLAGRAAEQLMLTDVSAGSGGPSGSDLAIATNLALKIDTTTGLGAVGPVWRGETATLMLHDNYQMQRVRRRLEDAQMTAENILERNRSLLEDMAKVLVSKRELSGPQLEDLLGRVEPERGEETTLRGQHELHNGRSISKSDGIGDCDGFHSITK